MTQEGERVCNVLLEHAENFSADKPPDVYLRSEEGQALREDLERLFRELACPPRPATPLVRSARASVSGSGANTVREHDFVGDYLEGRNFTASGVANLLRTGFGLIVDGGLDGGPQGLGVERFLGQGIFAAWVVLHSPCGADTASEISEGAMALAWVLYHFVGSVWGTSIVHQLRVRFAFYWNLLEQARVVSERDGVETLVRRRRCFAPERELCHLLPLPLQAAACASGVWPVFGELGASAELFERAYRELVCRHYVSDDEANVSPWPRFLEKQD